MNSTSFTLPAMTLALVGGPVSSAYRDLTDCCERQWGLRHFATRHARLLSRALTAVWLAACAGAVLNPAGY